MTINDGNVMSLDQLCAHDAAHFLLLSCDACLLASLELLTGAMRLHRQLRTQVLQCAGMQQIGLSRSS